MTTVKTRRQGQSVIPLSVTGQRVNVVVCPDVGGNILYAKPIIADLINQANCYGLKLSDDLCENLNKLSLDEVAKCFADDVSAMNWTDPVFLLGHSFAGYVAYATAYQLSLRGETPHQVFMLDMPPTGMSIYQQLVGSPRRLRQYLADRSAEFLRFCSRKEAGPKVLHAFGYLRIDLAAHPRSNNTVLISMYRMLTSYRTKVSPEAINVTLLIAEQGRFRRWRPKDLGWSCLCKGKVVVHYVPGDHLTMLRDTNHARVLGATIGRIVSASAASTAPAAGDGAHPSHYGLPPI